MATRPKRPRDSNQLAKMIVDISTGEAQQDVPPTLKQLAGSKGGTKGGPARAESLSSSRRQEIAKKAAKKLWKKITEVVD